MKKIVIIVLVIIILVSIFFLGKNIALNNQVESTKHYIIDNLRKDKIEIEGKETEITVVTYHSDLGYRLDYDKNNFTKQRINDVDRFTLLSNKKIYFEVKKIKKEEYNKKKSMFNVYKYDDKNHYLYIKINCPDDPEYIGKILTRIYYSIDSIEFE